MCLSNNRALKHIRQKQNWKEKMTDIKLCSGDFNTSSLSNKQKQETETSKDTEEVSTIISQWELIDVYKILHPTVAEHTFFSVHMEHSPR